MEEETQETENEEVQFEVIEEASFTVMDIVKGGLELVVAGGVAAVIGNIVKATTPDDLNRWQRLGVAVGSSALAGLLGEMAGKRASDNLDKRVAQLKAILSVAKDDTIIVVEEVKPVSEEA